jgi:hypothetical protein
VGEGPNAFSCNNRSASNKIVAAKEVKAIPTGTFEHELDDKNATALLGLRQSLVVKVESYGSSPCTNFFQSIIGSSSIILSKPR